jgi:FKBP-type peptidyl-prolyl cis-trans isomerase
MRYILFILTAFIFLACSDNPKPEFKQLTQKEIEDALIIANKNALKKESDQIDAYAKRRNLDVIKTGTGLRYQIYEKGEGEKATLEKRAVVNYEVTLLDGTVCYSTKEKGTEVFTIGKDNVESGLHEGISYMSAGDKAIIIIPSHLAHGLAGDFEKIPVRSTIVYDIELVAIK